MKRPSIILIIASSLDGRISFPHGGKADIGSAEDKLLLNHSLNMLDATLFGSGTLKAHESTYLIKEINDSKKIISNYQPISIVVGNVNNFSINWPYFKQPISRWLINSTKKEKKTSYNFEKELNFKENWAKTLNILWKEGLRTVGLLGGSKLINSFAKENLIDEIKITFCPIIIGGEFSWIPSEKKSKIFNHKNKWIIKSQKKLETNEVFIHYIKRKN